MGESVVIGVLAAIEVAAIGAAIVFVHRQARLQRRRGGEANR